MSPADNQALPRAARQMEEAYRALRAALGSPGVEVSRRYLEAVLADACAAAGEGCTDERNRELCAQIGLLNRLIDAFVV